MKCAPWNFGWAFCPNCGGMPSAGLDWDAVASDHAIKSLAVDFKDARSLLFVIGGVAQYPGNVKLFDLIQTCQSRRVSTR